MEWKPKDWKTNLFGKNPSDWYVVGSVLGLGAMIGFIVYSFRQSTVLQAQANASSAPTPQQIADQQDQVPPFVPGDYGSGGGPGGLTPSGGS